MKQWLFHLAVALALIPTVGAAQNLDENGRSEPTAASADSLFEFQEGVDDSAFYMREHFRLLEEVLIPALEKANVEEAKAINRQYADALKRLTQQLMRFDDDDSKRTTIVALKNYVYSLAVSDQIDALKNALNDDLFRERPEALAYAQYELDHLESEKRAFIRLQTVIYPLKRACAENDADAANRYVDAFVREALDDDKLAKTAFGWADEIKNVNPKIELNLEEKLVDAFMKSEDPIRKKLAEERVAQNRFKSLKGAEIKVEGRYLDGEEIDWSQFRGKVVLIDFWATWCGPCVQEFPNAVKLYGKYHDAGFEIVGYSLDEDLNALESYAKTLDLPWKTLSQRRTLDAKDENGKKYLDMASYYGVRNIPCMILVDRDGKVIDTDARGERLEELLQEAFQGVETQEIDKQILQKSKRIRSELYRLRSERYKKALEEDDGDFDALESLIVIAYNYKEWDDLMAFVERAVKIKGDDVEALVSSAYLLATCPKPELRNGKLALERAQAAMKITSRDDPEVLSPLACAYAELGDFQNAVDAAQKAYDIMKDPEGNDCQDAKQCLKMIESFKAGKPWREE